MSRTGFGLESGSSGGRAKEVLNAGASLCVPWGELLLSSYSGTEGKNVVNTESAEGKEKKQELNSVISGSPW
jgi:hypothetical protein